MFFTLRQKNISNFQTRHLTHSCGPSCRWYL